MTTKKALDVLCYSFGAVSWPWLGGYFMGLEDSLGHGLVVATCFGWAFVAWWKFFGWIRKRMAQKAD